MDEAHAELLAGGTSFPFSLVPGYAGFSTPSDFAKFNRGLAAKILVMRATFNSCAACWAQASTAINASFITTANLPASLSTGVYYGYTGAAGEFSNPITEALTSNRYWVHPSIVTGCELSAPLSSCEGSVTPVTVLLGDAAAADQIGLTCSSWWAGSHWIVTCVT